VAENALQIEIRSSVGKGVARKLRAAGRIPGVVYGRSTAAVPVLLDPKALRRVLVRSEAGLNTLFELEVASGGELHGLPVLVRELQRDPVNGAYLHADLLAVDLLQRIQVSVPIHVTGKAHGVELGGILDHSLRELELFCLPTAIPKEVTVDVSTLEVGQSLHVRDLVLPEGVELRSDPDLSVVSVVVPAAEVTPTPAEAAPAEGEAAAAPAEGEGEEKEAKGKEAKGKEAKGKEEESSE
jgi:large subunit ribosomal protein L25